MCNMNIATKLFPFLKWFHDYSGGKFKIDLLAGITVALVLIPQSMAYAQLAGLPAYYGLYAAFLPPMVAALFGSSKQLATGPVAVVSLMSAAALEPLATAGSTEFIAYSIALALTVGLFQLSLGILRLGLVVNFLSHPVVNGFTNAAAIIIATSQLPKLFGVSVDKATHHYETIIRVFQAALDYTHIPTLIFGISAIVIMAVLKKINPRIPNVLVAVGLATIISYFSGFNSDTHLSINRINNTEIQENIKTFNNLIEEITLVGDKRSTIGIKVDEEQERQTTDFETIALIKLKTDVAIMNTLIAELKKRSATIRYDLRHAKFVGIKEASGLRLYLQDQVPAGLNSDGKTWRLNVGRSQLNPDELKFMSGGAVIGKVPAGIPSLSTPDVSIKTFTKLLPTAIIISLLGFMEAIAIAKAMAAQTGQKLDPNQELIGQGLANIVGSFGSSYAVSGSFSRSAVNLGAGAVSGISSVITSVVVLITLIFFTPLLYHLPQAVLAAVIMMAVVGLLNVKGFIHSWKAQWYDGLISIISFIVTLYFAPHLDKGIMVGVALSMTVFLYKSMRPVVARLSLNKERVLANADYYRLRGCKHISVVRFDGALFFANASYLDEQVEKFRMEQPELRYILLDARGINDMDASGEEALDMLYKRVRSANLGFAICGLKGQVVDVMVRTGLYDKIGSEYIHADSKSAVSAITKIIHQLPDLPSDGCDDCPLTQYLPNAD
ncbi:probable high affinity sulfate transporter (SulP) [Desulfotalea psychrophila LSv54]|uniref:Probable high affinity sulfate transporter (SulP) n=2 Tax=Desulfotalea psychrophila TaxID=84980 RepID=Q6APZ5_DESPS|nr:probable high affinity sulfate transporter (SulP) [Desulfotalea psychrophila LSv54]